MANNPEKLVPLSDAESTSLEDGDFVQFWRSRFERGDPWAKNALGIWDPTYPGVPEDNVDMGVDTVNRLLSYMLKRDGLADMRMTTKAAAMETYSGELSEIGLGLARSHASYLHESGGSAVTFEQSNKYHHAIFERHNLPAEAYGGTPFGKSFHGIQADLLNRWKNYCENGCKNI